MCTAPSAKPSTSSRTFARGAGGDALDLRQLLAGQSVNAANLSSYVRLTEANGSTTVAIDANGASAGSAFIDVAVLVVQTGLSADLMLANGNLLVT